MIKVTDSFLDLPSEDRRCQNEETLEDCKTKAFRDAITRACKCIPFSLRNYSADSAVSHRWQLLHSDPRAWVWISKFIISGKALRLCRLQLRPASDCELPALRPTLHWHVRACCQVYSGYSGSGADKRYLRCLHPFQNRILYWHHLPSRH